MVTQNYFDLPEVSCSNLKELDLACKAIEQERDLTEIFNFGSLVDAMLTEPWRVNSGVSIVSYCRLLKEDGGVIEFTKETYDLAKKLVKNMKSDKLVSMLIDNLIGQYVFRKTISFRYQDEEYKIKGRCKFDGFSKRFKIGVDYKGLACTTRKAFIDAVDYFSYDMQAAYYMDLAKIDRFWIIAVSKITGEVFKLAIQRDDETYQRGLAKYSRLAYKWILLIENFTICKS